MKQIIFKTLLYILLLIGLFAIIEILACKFLDNEVLKYDLTIKIRSLITSEDEYQLIIGGDSRAERQIIPILLKEYSNSNVVNLSTAGEQLITTVNAYEKYNLTNNKTILLSVSSPNINDGNLRNFQTNLNYSYIPNIPPLKKISLFGLTYFEKIANTYYVFISEKILCNVKIDNQRIGNLGFLPVEGCLYDTSFVPEWSTHPWYFNSNPNGIKKELFIKAVEKMSKWNSMVVLFNPPVAPLWHQHYKGTPIDTFEVYYSNFLEELCEKYSNIHFIDFYNNGIEALDNSKFYNMQHTNSDGAKIFTESFIKHLNQINHDELVRKNSSSFRGNEQ